MDSAKWQIIKKIFSTVVDLPKEKRFDVLAQETDEEIRIQVEKLLEAHETAENFIDKPLLIEQQVVEDTTVDPLIGKQIKDYLILERIGTGGMGAVYLAERLNSDFKQKVALKIIKRGMDSEAILKRFAIERKILSTLKHPNIAQLLDGGISTDGLPFFVMEYIEGQTLIQYCQQNNLSLKDRLKLFQQICAAVEYAHRNLIIHRDLKPSNVLVTNDGVPKLLDFGVSKLLSDPETEITLTQNRVFTPEYASPEQILDKNVTTATDIYSLGIILYELLSGHRPYQTKGKPLDEIIKIVCDSKVTKPSEATTKFYPSETRNLNLFIQDSKIISGDLDNITLKTINKEPAERYGTVQQLTEDIERYLNGFPVIARPQTATYRFGKYIKRHKVGVLAAALVLVSLIGGISVASWQAIEARREREKAEQRFNDVRSLAKTVMFDLNKAIEEVPGSIAARELLVKKSLEYLDKLAAENQQDTSLQMELAEGYDQIANIQGGSGSNHLGQRESALESYQKSLAIKERLVVIEPQNINFRQQFGVSYFNTAKIYYVQANMPESLKMAQKSVDILQTLFQENPQDSGIKYSLTNALLLKEVVLSQTGNIEESSQITKEVLKMAEELANENPSVNNLQTLANALNNYASFLVNFKKDNDEALKSYQRSFEIRKQLLDKDPNNISYQKDVATCYLNMTYIFYYKEDYQSALKNCRQALEILEKLKIQDSQNEEIKRFTIQTERWNSKILIKLGRGIEAIPSLENSLEKLEKQYAASPTDKLVYFEIGETKLQLGYVYETIAEKTKNQADRKKSCEYLQETYKIYQEFINSGYSGTAAFNEKELSHFLQEVKNCSQ